MFAFMTAMPAWIKTAALAVAATILIGIGYKIGTWKEAAAQAREIAQCKADLGAQREADLSSANHALADELKKASDLAHADAQTLGDLARTAQENASAFADQTRALYASVVGGCTLGPDLVRVLNEASGQANRDLPIGAGPRPSDSGHAAGSGVPPAAARPGAAPAGKTGADRWRGVDSGSRSVRVGA